MRDPLPSGEVTLQEALRAGSAWLEGAGLEAPRHDTETLLLEALGLEGGQLDANAALSPQVAAVMRQRLRRRAAREPIPYILGYCDFRGIQLMVDRRVVVPDDRRTGLLVDLAAELPPQQRVLDVCTGSGAVALALKGRRPDLDVRGSDVSPTALEVARANAQRLCLDVEFVWWRDIPPGEYDLVVAAPPYADEAAQVLVVPPESALHAPRVAIYGGTDGLDVIRGLIRSARVGTRLAVEHAPGQAEAVRTMLDHAKTIRDPEGEERVTVGKVKSWARGREHHVDEISTVETVDAERYVIHNLL
jgi:release factor glutamine methyltransferase